jgi:hypothetical protein
MTQHDSPGKTPTPRENQNFEPTSSDSRQNQLSSSSDNLGLSTKRRKKNGHRAFSLRAFLVSDSRLFWRLLGLGLFFRVISSFTNLSTFHPDEWFQTVEFANMIAFGFASRSGELMTHMRNLTWPWILSHPMEWSQYFFEGSLYAKIVSIKLTTALLDFSLFFILLRAIFLTPRATSNLKWGAALVVTLSPFYIPESVRPSQEHLSAIVCWIALALTLQLPWVRTRSLVDLQIENTKRFSHRLTLISIGVLSVMTGAFRFASGLFGAGILVSLTVHLLLNARSYPTHRSAAFFKPFLTLIFGVLLGLALGGAADFYYYGRPWEGLWMYFQYNVLTGLSKTNFGEQSAYTYVEYFLGIFSGPFFWMKWAVPTVGLLGWVTGLIRFSPMAWAFGLFVLGHSLIGHKETRFMAPVIWLLFWQVWMGIVELGVLLRGSSFFTPARALQPKGLLHFLTSSLARILISVWVIWASALMMRGLWGETWRLLPNFLELPSLLKEAPTCAVITVRRPLASLVPYEGTSEVEQLETTPSNVELKVPYPALAFFPAPGHFKSSEYINSRPLIWLMQAPQCNDTKTVLLQVQQPENYWTEVHQCELQRSGILKWVSRQQWNTLVSKNLVSAPWYRCPSKVLTAFTRSEVRNMIQTKWTSVKQLPPPGISPTQYTKMAWGELDPNSPETRDGTFGEW